MNVTGADRSWKGRYAVGFFGLCLIAGAAFPHPAFAAYALDGNGKIDPDELKIDAQFVNNKYLLAAASDAGVKLGSMQTMELTGPDTELENARSQYRQGRITREKFLTTARQRLAKRQAAVDAALKSDKAKCQQQLQDDPHWQVEMFGELLRAGLFELRLPSNVSEQTAGWISSHSNDIEQERRDSKPFGGKLTGSSSALRRDAAWVKQMEQDRTGHAMNPLSVAQRAELAKAWPVLFAGAAKPAIDDASYADVGKTMAPIVSAPKPMDRGSAKPTDTVAKPTPAPAIPVEPPANNGKAIELLPLADLASSTISGDWKSTPTGALRNAAGGDPQKEPSKIVLPATASGSYELSFTLSRVEGQNALCVLLPVGKNNAQIWLGSGNPRQDGESDYIQSTGSTGGGKQHPIGHNKLHKMRVCVDAKAANATIDVYMDNFALLHWTGSSQRLNARKPWALPTAGSLGFAAEPTSAYEIGDIRIVPIGDGVVEKVK